MNKIFAFIIIGLFLPSAAWAEEPRSSIEATVNALLEILYGAKKPDSVEDRENAVRRAIEKRYSFDVVVQRALGANRRRLSPAELEQIVSLTTDLMIRTYSKRFAAAQRPQVTYGETRDVGRGRVELSSKAKLGEGTYGVIYRMAKTPSGWQIYDIVIEGVSLVANYRKQFEQHFSRGLDGAELIAQLKKQIDSAR